MQAMTRWMRRTLMLTAIGALLATVTGSGATARSAVEGKSLAPSAAATPGRAEVGTTVTPSAAQLTAHGDPPDPTDVSNELKKVYQHIEENFDAHLARMVEWVRIPSISSTVEGEPALWESAQFIKDVLIEELGCTAEIHGPGVGEWGTVGHPVVYGRCDEGAEKTVLDYVQGDVMPIWPIDDWPAPPFGGRMMEKPPFKRVLVGRGASNQKGKEMAELNALISIKAVTGTLPVNMIFIVEHDEERVEVGLRKFMFDHPELFEDVDAVFAYARSQKADGRGTTQGQSVGCLVFELETSRWEGPRLWLDQQPQWRHFQMLTRMFADDSPLMKELHEDVLQPSAEEEAYLRREAELTGGDPSFEELLKRRTRVRPTITGTWAGNMAPGYAGRYDPLVATSKIDLRFPPEAEGKDLVNKIRAYLHREGYEDVKMNVVGIVEWSWANFDNDMGRAVLRMYDQFGVPYNKPPKGDFFGAYTPYGPQYLFSRGVIKLPNAWGGLGYGWGAHSAPEGEYYVIEGDGDKIYGFAGAMKAYATVLYNYAGKNPPASGSLDRSDADDGRMAASDE